MRQIKESNWPEKWPQIMSLLDEEIILGHAYQEWLVDVQSRFYRANYVYNAAVFNDLGIFYTLFVLVLFSCFIFSNSPCKLFYLFDKRHFAY